MDFLTDGGNGVDPVYLKVPNKALYEIFPLNYSVKDMCALCGSPSEKGVIQYDNKVRKPAVITFTGIVKYSAYDVFADLIETLRATKPATMFCTFYAKSAGKINPDDYMILESVEEIGDNQRYDGVEVRITLMEFLHHGRI